MERNSLKIFAFSLPSEDQEATKPTTRRIYKVAYGRGIIYTNGAVSPFLSINPSNGSRCQIIVKF
jgi:hypothetical protein